MHILWLKRLVRDAGGDAVVDAKFSIELRKHHEVSVIEVKKNTLVIRLLRMLTNLLPPDRAGFGTSKDINRVVELCHSGNVDVIIISHEYLDYMSRVKVLQTLSIPIVVIHHNITSSAMNEILGGMRGRIAQIYYRLYERQLVNKAKIFSHIVLSHEDKRHLEKIIEKSNVNVVMPGAPPSTVLKASAKVEPDLVLLGTFDWYPKLWSLEKFVHEWEESQGAFNSIYVDTEFPEWAMKRLSAKPVQSLDLGGAIRFGILTDRFKAGHKLKIAAYIMSNCFVLSYTSVIEDYRFSKNADFFIRRINCLEDIKAVMNEIANYEVDTLRIRFENFKKEVVENMSWDKQANIISRIIDPLSEK